MVDSPGSHAPTCSLSSFVFSALYEDTLISIPMNIFSLRLRYILFSFNFPLPPEIKMAKIFWGLEAPSTWEWELPSPVRSVITPLLTVGVPFNMLSQLSSFFEVGPLPFFLFLLGRFTPFIMTIVLGISPLSSTLLMILRLHVLLLHERNERNICVLVILDDVLVSPSPLFQYL